MIGYTLELQEGYYKTSKSTTKDIDKAKIYTHLAYLFKYAAPNFMENNQIKEGVQLIQLQYDEKNGVTAVLSLGELWAASAMYVYGYQNGYQTAKEEI